MKTNKIIFTLVAILALVSACKKEDNILPVGEPPFKGIYNPSEQIQQLNLTTLQVNSAGDTVTTNNALVMRWFWDVNRLLGINCNQTVGDTIYRFGRSFQYNKNRQLVQVGTDFFLTYSNGRISYIRIQANSLNYTYHVHYNGGDYPDFLSYNIYSKDSPDIEYRLRWKDGNLVTVVPGIRDIDSATYTYDRMGNPFCGVFWPDQWKQEKLLMQIPFISRNNPESITLYKDGNVVETHLFRYEYIDTKPFHIYFSMPTTDKEGNSTTTHYTYTLHY